MLPRLDFQNRPVLLPSLFPSLFPRLAAMFVLSVLNQWPALAAAEPERPNVLILVSDDQGYHDAGFQGSSEIKTPHLDRLARSGIRCTNGYASHPFCSPTRAGLLTGRYQARFGHEYNPVYDPLDSREGLPLSQRLLPSYLHAAGYRTGWVGKWHLGSSPSHLPSTRGFEETYGFVGGGHRYQNWEPNGRQYTLPLTRQGKPLEEVPSHLTTAFGAEAAAFIRRHSPEPWLLYVAFNAPHTPHEPTAEREARFATITNPARRRNLAQISLLDDAVGAITAALRDSHQAERTLVFFVGDNGGSVQNGGDNSPLRGQKGALDEGGVRVPYLVSWPQHLPAGDTFDAPVSTLDIFATALHVAGVPLPDDRIYDGVNLIPHLTGKPSEPPHQELYWRLQQKNGASLAMRSSGWKLIRPAAGPLELYDLSTDVGETKNLAAEQPEVARQLNQALTIWNAQLVEPAFPGSSVKNEDWGPGGANQQNVPPKQKDSRPRAAKS